MVAQMCCINRPIASHSGGDFFLEQIFTGKKSLIK